MEIKELVGLNLVVILLLIGAARLFALGRQDALREVEQMQRSIYQGKLVGFPTVGSDVQVMLERGADVIQFFPETYIMYAPVDLRNMTNRHLRGYDYGTTVLHAKWDITAPPLESVDSTSHPPEP